MLVIFVLSNLRFVSIFGHVNVLIVGLKTNTKEAMKLNDILTSQLGLKVALVQTSHFTCAEFNVDEQKIGHHWPFTF